MLIELSTDFNAYSNELKSAHEQNVDISVFKDRPFENDYMYKMSKTTREMLRKIRQLHREDPIQRAIVYGVVPWNRLGFISKLFSDYASNRCLFRLDNESTIMPEFYIYVPELVVAKLSADWYRSKFKPFKSQSTVYAAEFLDKLEILDEQPLDSFYPFPLHSTPAKLKLYPYNTLNLNKMYLVNLKFKSEFEIERGGDGSKKESDPLMHHTDKYLFYKFVEAMYTRKKYSVIRALRSMFTAARFDKHNPVKLSNIKEVELIETMCMKLGIRTYGAVETQNVFSFRKLMSMIINNSASRNALNHLMMRRHEMDENVSPSPSKIRSNNVNALISANESSKSGIVRIPRMIKTFK